MFSPGLARAYQVFSLGLAEAFQLFSPGLAEAFGHSIQLHHPYSKPAPIPRWQITPENSQVNGCLNGVLSIVCAANHAR